MHAFNDLVSFYQLAYLCGRVGKLEGGCMKFFLTVLWRRGISILGNGGLQDEAYFFRNYMAKILRIRY